MNALIDLERLKKDIKFKVRDFLNSEKSRVGVKMPLALGDVTAGGLLLVQAFFTTPAEALGDTVETKRLCLW